MSRIQITDNTLNVVSKMSECNPGAMAALCAILKEHDAIDPQSAMGGLGAILMLDTWGIYGSDIYVLWSGKCQKDCRKMLMIMRACQMGNFSHMKLKEMAAGQSDLTPEQWQAQDDWVCSQLQGFMKP